MNQDGRRKLKQVYHLTNFIEPLLAELKQLNEHKVGGGEITLADHEAGRSYIGFTLHELFFKGVDDGQIFGIENRPDLVEKLIALAQRLKFSHMRSIST